MTTPALDSEPASLERISAPEEEQRLRRAVLSLFQASGYSPLRALQCEVRGGVIVVSGIVPSFYLKQLAQTVIVRLEGVKGVTNLVTVRTSRDESAS